MIAAKEARKFSWAGTGSAATSTASNGTSAGVLTLVRSRWFSKPLSICIDEAGFLCPNPRLAGRVIHVMGREILLFTFFRALRRFPQRFLRQFDARRVFSHERRKAPFHFGSRFQLPAQFVARPVHARRQPLASETGSISGHSRVNHTRAD